MADLPDTIDVNGKVSFKVTFKPSDTGSFDVTLTIFSNDPDNNHYTLSIHGHAFEGSNLTYVPATNKEVLFFPNPSKGSIFIPDHESVKHVRLFFSTGILVYCMADPEYTCNLTNLPPGLYMVEIFKNKKPFYCSLILR